LSEYKAVAQLNTTDQVEVEARREALLKQLDQAIAPGWVLLALRAVGLNAADISVAVGANPRTAASWLEEDPPLIKKKRHQQRIRELKEVTRFIVANGVISLQEADWLRDPNRGADFSTPLELIGVGKWQEAGRLYCGDVGAEVPPMFLGDRELRPAGIAEP
jgi:nitroreductase